MANNFANTSWVSMQILRLTLNKLVIADYFNKGWQDEYQKEFAPGSPVSVKFPQRFTVSRQIGYDPQGINRLTTTIPLDTWLQVGFDWDDYERAVKLERSKEELQRNYWEPAGAAIAQEIDAVCADFGRKNASNTVGVLGTDPTSVSTYYQARQVLMEEACPPGKRCAAISSSMMQSLGSNISTVFNPVDEITKMWKTGAIGNLAAFDFFESNSLYSHTAGTWAGSVTVTGAGQSGGTLVITGTNGDTIKAGDKFSIANVNRANPMTRRIPGKATARVFTVPQDYTLTGGSDTITILPAIYGPGSQYQNVDALPANNAALTLWPGTSSPNGKVGTVALGLSQYAFALVGAKLYLPKSTEDAGQAQDPDSGIAIRKVLAWDPRGSLEIKRLDSLIGVGNLYQSNGAVAIAGA